MSSCLVARAFRQYCCIIEPFLLTYLDRQISHDEVKVRFGQELLLDPVSPGFVLVREGFCPAKNLVKAK